MGVLTWRQAERSRAFRTSFTFSGKKRTPPKAPIWGYGLGVPKETSTILKIGKNESPLISRKNIQICEPCSVFIFVLKIWSSNIIPFFGLIMWKLVVGFVAPNGSWISFRPETNQRYAYGLKAWKLSTVWCPCKWCKVFWYRYKQSIQPVSSSFFFPLTQIFWGWISPSFLFVLAFQSLQLSPNGIGSTGSSNRGK